MGRDRLSETVGLRADIRISLQHFSGILPIGQARGPGIHFAEDMHLRIGSLPDPAEMFELFRSHCFVFNMVAQQHYQRLKHLYAADPAENATGPVDISYGFAELVGIVEGTSPTGVMNRVPFQRFLSDASSLAAGSVEKDGLLTMDRFSLSVERPEYRGPVRATAEVVFAEPPRYHVRAVLLGEDEEPVAESLALFEPSGEDLPPDPAPEAGDEESHAPPPAPFMPGHVTRYGVLCLN